MKPTTFFLSLFLVACWDDALEDNYCHSIVKTPNARRGVLCYKACSLPDCYKFISANCPGGYDFLWDTPISAMVECKKQEPGQ